MKILVHHIFYRPEPIGNGTYTAEMCEWLVQRGHAVRVVCPPPYYPQWRVQPPFRQWRYYTEVIGGVCVTRCPLWVPRRPSGLRRILYALSFMVSSLPVVVRQTLWRPDVVFVVEPSLLNAVPSLLAAKCSGAVSWLHVQDFELDIAFKLGQVRSSLLQALLVGFESWLLKHFDVVSTISRAMEIRLSQKGVEPRRQVLFPNWVDTTVIYPMTQPSSFRSELGIPQATVVCLFSGTMNAKQGVEVLIQAACLLSSHEQIQFVLCGDGPVAAKMRGLAASLRNVRFLPLQPLNRLNDLLNLADIHLLPQDPAVEDLVLPSKLLGMLATGRPVIAGVSPRSEVGQVVSRCGVIVPPGDPVGWAAAIESLAGDPASRARFGAAARQYALESLNKDLVLSQFEQDLRARLEART